MQTKLKINCLAQVTPAQFEKYCGIMPAVIRKRTKHVIDECERVRLAQKALKTGEINKLGKLLNESHSSLSKLYEVTGNEPDALAEAAQSFTGCLGSRLMGGGFGGCTLSLVKTDSIEEFKKYVYDKYLNATGYKAEFYETELSDGITVEKLI